MNLALRGLTYPKVRPQAYRIVPRETISRLQIMLLEDPRCGEEEFTRWVKSRADLHGWQGYHLRQSLAVLESVHTERFDGYTESKGLPDWRFWHERRHQHFDAELKGATGRLEKDQRRTLPSMRRGGILVFEWYPRQWAEVERIFREGLA